MRGLGLNTCVMPTNAIILKNICKNLWVTHTWTLTQIPVGIIRRVKTAPKDASQISQLEMDMVKSAMAATAYLAAVKSN